MKAIQYGVNIQKTNGYTVEFNMTFEDVNGDIFTIDQTISSSRDKCINVFQEKEGYWELLEPTNDNHKRVVLAFRSQKIALDWDNY